MKQNELIECIAKVIFGMYSEGVDPDVTGIIVGDAFGFELAVKGGVRAAELAGVIPDDDD